MDILKEVPLNKSKDKVYMNKYRCEYYRHKYQNNKAYRDTIRKYNKLKYNRVTINCIKCEKRWKIETLNSINYKFKENNFECPDCIPEHKIVQFKSKRGRPKKEPVAKIDKETMTDTE
jgi:hypothetical protein